MKKLLNTLYVTINDAYLSRDGENVVVLVGNEERFRIPIHNIEGIVCFNYTGVSPKLLALCCERGVKVSFISESGYFLARVSGKIKGNVLLRKRQYQIYDDKLESIKIAKNFVIGKLHNARYVLMRFIRDHGEKLTDNVLEIRESIEKLLYCIKRTLKINDFNELIGIEGEGTHWYYKVFDNLILKQKENFYFIGRSRRPPLDYVNALLSFLYVLLAHDCENACEAVGLDPQVGFLHKIRPGRYSLALDLMEELRPYLVDRLALTLINNEQINKNDFIIKETGGVIIKEEARKEIIAAWQKRKQDEIIHPYLGERIKIGLIAHVQAMLLSRYIRQDIDNYPPFLVR